MRQRPALRRGGLRQRRAAARHRGVLDARRARRCSSAAAVEFTLEHKRELLGTSAAGGRGRARADARRARRAGRQLIVELGMLVLERDGALRAAAPRRARAARAPAARRRSRWRSPPTRRGCWSTGRSRPRSIDAGTFAAILTADVVTDPKPAPEIYLAACAALGTEPARTLVLEDSPTGVAAAVAAGCYTIAVPSLAGVDLGAGVADRRLARRARDHAGARPVTPSASACRSSAAITNATCSSKGTPSSSAALCELLAVDRRGERRLLELLAHRLRRQPVDALRAHHRAGDRGSRSARRPRAACAPSALSRATPR